MPALPASCQSETSVVPRLKSPRVVARGPRRATVSPVLALRGFKTLVDLTYGQTEASVYITAQPDGEVYSDTVGKPNLEVEIKIADSGEVMFRSPGVFLKYYKNDEATKETKTPDGWVHTGDAGFFDQRGHLKIIDRAKDVGRLNNGAMFAPKYL